MAIYGISFYGSDLYGEPIISVLNVSPFTAESRAPGEVRLRWTAPGGEWSEFRLLRSGYGFAVNEEDGDIILSFTGPNYQSAYTDTGLAENRFYYYTVFVFDLDTNLWVKAGEVQALTLKDYGNRERMLLNLPQFYLDMDDQRRNVGESEGALRRFLRLLSLVADHVQGETESLGWVRDPDTVSGGLLPFFSHDLGITYEPEIGMRQMRIWLRNAVYLYKIKGTRLGIEGIATAFTGWGADAQVPSPSHNLISNPDFATDSMLWTSSSPSIQLQIVSGGRRPDTRSLQARITTTAVVGGSLTGPTIPVTAGQTYAFSLWGRYTGSTARPATAQPLVRWLRADDSESRVVAGDPHNLGGDWEQMSVISEAPADATQVEIVIDLPAEDRVTDDQFFFTDMILEQNDEARGDFFKGVTAFGVDDITIHFQANRINLISNPSFEVDTSGWTGDTTISQESDVDPHVGTGALRVTEGGLPDRSFISTTAPATEGRSYAASIYLKAVSGGTSAALKVDFLDDASAVLDTVSTSRVITDTEYSRLAVVGSAPEGTVEARITFSVALDAGGEYLADGALFEEGPEVRDYFDASFLGGDYLWEGTAHASPSHYYFNRAIKNARLNEVMEEYAPLGTTWNFLYAQP